MTFEEIVEEIKSGMSGDAEKDIVYLQAKMEEYKDHEMATELLRACGRMFAEVIPEDKKEELVRALKDDRSDIYVDLEKSRVYISTGKIEDALQISARLVKKADQNPMFASDEVSEYYTFREFFEEVLYIYYHRPSKRVRKAEYPFADIYLQHGSNLVENGQYVEAREVLEKARRWAPTNCNILFEYIETFKATGEMEEFAKYTREAFQYAFHVEHIARCYRNMGYYFIEKEEYPVALMCYILSTQFEKSEVAQREIAFINSKLKGQEVQLGDMKEIEGKVGLSTDTIRQNVEVAIAYGQHFLDQGEKDGAKYCYAIAYQMTGNAEIRKKLESIE